MSTTYIDFKGISELLRAAADEGRSFLFEYEVYNFLSLLGAETPPQCFLIPRGARPSEDEMTALPGEKVV